MRKVHKYKRQTQIELISKFPLRVLRFKRPKWHYIKESFLINSVLDKDLIDVTSIKNDFKAWDKVSDSYKVRLRHYSFLSASLNNSINVKKLKKPSSIKVRKEMLSKFYFNNYYKACTLTWFANFYASSFEAKQKIHSKNLFVNNKIATSNSLLNKGDILSIKDTNINIENIFKKYSKTLSMITNVEIDYYTQEIIIIKDIKDLSEEDFFLLSLDYINIQTLR
jgi:hypothetical protein